MKITEVRGKLALEAIADLINPIARLANNEDFQRLRRQKTDNFSVAEALLRADEDAVMEILAVINGVPVEEYNPSVLEILTSVVELLNIPEVKTLFFSPEQTEAKKSSGSATDDTQE